MKNYVIKINSPCNQDWASMKVNQSGRFCELCSKNVVDFTTYSDRRLQETLLNSGNRICGKLTVSQLNRELLNTRGTNKLRGLISILTGLTLITSSKEGLANNKTESFEINSSITPRPQKVSKLELKRDSIKYQISGTVYEYETKEPLAGATIMIQDKKYGILTKPDGTFNLKIPESFLDKELTVVVLFIGYKTQEFIINRKMLPLNRNIFLEPADETLTGEVIIIQKRKWWQRKKKNCH